MLSIKFIPEGFEGEENTNIINKSISMYLYTTLCTVQSALQMTDNLIKKKRSRAINASVSQMRKSWFGVKPHMSLKIQSES